MDHTLFLAYINQPEKTSSVRPVTVANWAQQLMREAGISDDYTAHSIRSVSSTKAVVKGNPIGKVKEHANWSLKSNTFEKNYYKPNHKLQDSTLIQNSIFYLLKTISH